MIKVIKDNIALESPVLDETTKSGVIKGEKVLADEAKEIYTFKVLEVGKDVKEVLPGDKIFLRHGVNITKIKTEDGVSYGIVSEHMVLAVEYWHLERIFIKL